MKIHAIARLKEVLAAGAPKSTYDWNRLDNHQGYWIDYKGHRLEIKWDPTKKSDFIGLIDGKQVDQCQNDGPSMDKMAVRLINDLDDSPVKNPESFTGMIRTIERLPRADVNGWDLDGVEPGDMLGKNKKTAFVVEYEKEIESGTRILLQAEFTTETSGKSRIGFWLMRMGSVVSFGGPWKFTPKAGDFDSFLSELKKALKIPDKTILEAFKKSSMYHYGRD